MTQFFVNKMKPNESVPISTYLYAMKKSQPQFLLKEIQFLTGALIVPYAVLGEPFHMF